mgnify:FL=1
MESVSSPPAQTKRVNDAPLIVESRVPNPKSRRRLFFSLSSRLLVLTAGFVLLAEAAVFAPTMGRFRLDYLRERIATAHLVMTALETLPQQIDPNVRDRLLDQGGMLGMTVNSPNARTLSLGSGVQGRTPHYYDLRDDRFWTLIADAFLAMVREGDTVIAVTDVSPANPDVVVDVVLAERPLREAMWDYAGRIFILSIVISVTVAGLVYGALQWLAVRPLHRLTESMTGFQEAPEDPERVIVPGLRNDEVGVAEQALAEMQRELRSALLQKARLAGMGTAVTKISHDLKNILATAVLESGRLEAVSDPKIKRLTAGMVDAVDRAATLAATTLRFAKEGLPVVRKQDLRLQSFLKSTELRPTLSNCTLHVEGSPDAVIDADPDLLRRVLENLLRNAGEAGASNVSVSTRVNADRIELHISDDGPGLAPRAAENLFIPFAGSARAAGSGLGLPIAKELMRAQGGDLQLAHTSRDGTCFIIYLPA